MSIFAAVCVSMDVEFIDISAEVDPFAVQPYEVEDDIDDGVTPDTHEALCKLVMTTLASAGIKDGKLARQLGE